jgi:DNA-binding winged helix-turn-helix (wHTH) protein/dipeptidyl aminopeptidase/acylaminoacyl peptidase
MSVTHSELRSIRFSGFELDPRTEELRKDGVKLKFRGQPFHVLAMLLERPGEVVTREELQQRLWPDTFVDVERNLNTAVNKIREVLGDSAEAPRFVETLPRRGYRFVAPVETESPQTVQEATKKQGGQSERPRGSFLPYARVSIFGAIVLAGGVVAFWITSTGTQGRPRVVGFKQLTRDGHRKDGPLLSDGVRVYFNEWLPDGRSVVAQVSVKGGETSPVSVGVKSPHASDISKDGVSLLVASLDGLDEASIWIQPVAGGSPLRVGEIIAHDAAFGRDGTSIIYSKGHDIYSASQDGTASRKLMAVDHSADHFRFSPDHRILRFTQRDPYSDLRLVMNVSSDGREPRAMFNGYCGDWTPDGRYFIFARRDEGYALGHLDIWALPESRGFGWAGENRKPIRLTSGPDEFRSPVPAKDGRSIFTIGDSPRAEVVRYDSRSHEFVPYLGGISALGLAFSSDGKWVAYTSYPDGILWRSRVDGSEARQLTSPPMKVEMPRWSPDGKQIAFNAIIPGGSWNIYLVASAGGSPEHLLPSSQSQMDVDWSPDGKSLIFGSVFDPRASISILDVSSKHVAKLPGSEGLFSPHRSPDGRYISGTSAGSQRLMLFDVSTQKWVKPCDCEGTVGYPMWSRDSKYLYFEYIPEQDMSFRVVRLRMSDRKIEEVTNLEKVGRTSAGTFGAWFGLAPDDSPLVARDISSQEIYALEMEWP